MCGMCCVNKMEVPKKKLAGEEFIQRKMGEDGGR
jgi:hypothetical protein